MGISLNSDLILDIIILSCYSLTSLLIMAYIGKRLFRNPKDRRLSYKIIFVAVFCSFIYNTASSFEPIATLSNLPFSFHVQIITLDTTYRYLPSWASVFLYGGIALFLREERSNFQERFSSFGNRMQLVVESALFSALLVLLSVNAGLNVGELVEHGASSLLVSDHGYPGAITWAAQAIWLLTTMELFFSTKKLEKAHKAEYGSNSNGTERRSNVSKFRMRIIYLITLTYAIHVLLTVLFDYVSPPFVSVYDLLIGSSFFSTIILFPFVYRETNLELAVFEDFPALQGGVAPIFSQGVVVDLGSQETFGLHPEFTDIARNLSIRPRDESHAESEYPTALAGRGYTEIDAARREYRDWRKANGDVFSALSIVTVFIAQLSVSLVSLAYDTYGDETSDFSQGSRPTARDNVYSCWYTSTFISLMAGCLSGLAAALMARTTTLKTHSIFLPDGLADRTVPIILLFVSLMVAMATVTLVIGIFIYVWTMQSTYVAISMTMSGGIFTLAIFFAVVVYLTDVKTKKD